MKIQIIPNVNYELNHILEHKFEELEYLSEEVNDSYGLKLINLKPVIYCNSICLSQKVTSLVLDALKRRNYKVEIISRRYHYNLPGERAFVIHRVNIIIENIIISVDISHYKNLIIAVCRNGKRFVIRSLSDLTDGSFSIEEKYGDGTTIIRRENKVKWYEIKDFIYTNICAKIDNYESIENLLNSNPQKKKNNKIIEIYKDNRSIFKGTGDKFTSISSKEHYTDLNREIKQCENKVYGIKNIKNKEQIPLINIAQLATTIKFGLESLDYCIISHKIDFSPVFKKVHIENGSEEVRCNFKSFSEIRDCGPIVSGKVNVLGFQLRYVYMNYSYIWSVVDKGIDNLPILLAAKIENGCKLENFYSLSFNYQINLSAEKKELISLLGSAIKIKPTWKFLYDVSEIFDIAIRNTFVSRTRPCVSLTKTSVVRRKARENSKTDNLKRQKTSLDKKECIKKETRPKEQPKKWKRLEIELIMKWYESTKGFAQIDLENNQLKGTLKSLVLSIPAYKGTRESVKQWLEEKLRRRLKK